MTALASTLRPKPSYHVRFYRSEDRHRVRHICTETGFLGGPIDPIFQDRELFADYLTSYYTDIEPESTVVLEINGEIKGYVMASTQPRLHSVYETFHNIKLACLGLWRYFTRPYNSATRHYIHWIFTRARQETPYAPPNIPHFHFNVLPEARKVTHTRAMVDLLFTELAARGEKAIYAQMVAYEKRRGTRMFERYGFQRLNECEVTKYRSFVDEKIYLYTILKDLTQNQTLYGLDLHQKKEIVTPQ